MIYIYPIASTVSNLLTFFLSLVDTDNDSISTRRITEQEVISLLKNTDIEHGMFPVVVTDTQYGEREVVEKYEIMVEIHNSSKGHLPDFKKDDQIIILNKVGHVLITVT